MKWGGFSKAVDLSRDCNGAWKWDGNRKLDENWKWDRAWKCYGNWK